MAYNDNGSRDFRPSQKFEGNWSCSKCGASITSLPFNPDPSKLGQLKCRDCHKQSRPSSGGRDGGFRPRQKFQGEWECSKCGTTIHELPFEPDPRRLDQIKCQECHRQSRPARY